MAIGTKRRIRGAFVVLLLSFQAAQVSAAYNAAFCQSVAGTLNIHWQAVGGPFAPCTGIEITNGTLAQAATGSIIMSGTSVTNPACIGTAAYAFTLSADTTRLVGFDTASNVPMTLIRGAGEECFVGTWTLGADVFEAYIWAAAFPLLAPSVPALGTSVLFGLASLLAMAGMVLLRRRRI